MLDKNYWENRYQSGETGWDAGRVTTPIKTFIDSLTRKEQKYWYPGG
jgi:thiopurine S-methyltransferase